MTQETKLAALFQQLYGHPPTAIARAPGRVEFIGNHTDYNGGAVLGAGIDRHVWVAVSRGQPGKFRFSSDQKPAVHTLPAAAVAKQTGALAWMNYPLGVWV